MAQTVGLATPNAAPNIPRVSSRFIRPYSPVPTKVPPAGDAWLHEPKLDGYRLQIVKDGSDVRLYSRRGSDLTKLLATVAAALQGLACRSAIIDAELVLPDAKGRPDFRDLHRGWRSAGAQLAVFAFDLLHRDGKDLRALPLIERRRRLTRLLARSDVPCLYLVDTFEDGPALLGQCEAMGFEGVVSKRRDAAYVSGVSKNWRKTKTETWRRANTERWRMFEGGSRYEVSRATQKVAKPMPKAR
jgi:bifunctional non-homologous end joining protein LigD